VMTALPLKFAPVQVILDGIQEGDEIGGPYKMAQILSQSVYSQGAFNLDDVSKKYLNWWRAGSFDTGPTFDLTYKYIDQGIEQNKAVQITDSLQGGKTAGCNPAHRISPISGFPFISTQDIPQIAREEARLTHCHPLAGEVSSIVALLCRYMIEGFSWKVAQSKVREIETKIWGTVKTASLSRDGYAPNVMHTALHFLEMNECVWKAKAFSGPANYAPILVSVLNSVREKYSPS
jgi:ADP-ribosylglycohydrolase